jgi:hypothetical protein
MSTVMLARLFAALTLIAPVALLLTGDGGLFPPGVSWT